MQSAVTFFLPIINHASAWRPTVESLLEQSRPDWELILIDCDPARFMRQLLPSDARIRLFDQPLDSFGKALNLGLERANGKYCAPLRPGVRLPSAWMETLVEKLEAHPETALAFVGPSKDPLCLLRASLEGPVLFRRSSCDAMGDFDSELAGVEEWDYCLRFAERFPTLPIDLPSLYRNETSESRSCEEVVLRMQIKTLARWEKQQLVPFEVRPWLSFTCELLQASLEAHRTLSEMQLAGRLGTWARKLELQEETAERMALGRLLEGEREIRRQLEQSLERQAEEFRQAQEAVLRLSQEQERLLEQSHEREDALREQLSGIYRSKSWALITVIRGVLHPFKVLKNRFFVR